MSITLLNPEPARRLEGADRLASDLVIGAMELPDPGALERVQKAAAQLHNVDPAKIAGDDTRTAFWINVYNALRLLVFHLHPPVTSVPMSLSRFRSFGWRVGAHDYSLSIIHHGLLRGNRTPHWTLRPMLAKDDPRLGSAPGLFDPRIHFALAFGAISSPPARRYLSGMLDKQLREAERDYLLEHTRIDEKTPAVELPAMLRAYRKDFALETKLDALEWVTKRIPDPKKKQWLEDNRARVHVPWRLLAFGWAFPEQGWRK